MKTVSFPTNFKTLSGTRTNTYFDITVFVI